MSFLELVRKRCSIRKYSEQPVEQSKIDYILEAARLAPSAVNFQPWHLLLINSEEGKRKIRSCYHREWFNLAPHYIIVCGDHEQSWKRSDNKDHMNIDVAIITEHICLAAAEQNIGTCWVCNFDIVLCKKSFNIPEHIEPVALIPLGYPSEPTLFDDSTKKRKPIEAIIKRESF